MSKQQHLRRHKFCVIFTGRTAPYHITKPSGDNTELTIPSIATTVNMTCSLNVTIPANVMLVWMYNDSVVMATPPHQIISIDNGSTLVIDLQQLSNAGGIYQCVVNDTANGWLLRRMITLGVYTSVNNCMGSIWLRL